MINEDIQAAQAAYAARPFAVRWIDSNSAVTNRFDTFQEAFQYAQDMWVMIRKEAAERAHVESHLWQSNIQTPDGSIRLAYYFLADDISSYYR